MTKVPQDIQEMPLHLLRTNLLNTAVSFKNEQVRNNLFEHKLEGAKAQLRKKERLIQEITEI